MFSEGLRKGDQRILSGMESLDDLAANLQNSGGEYVVYRLNKNVGNTTAD
jgi:hypothetical protein